MRRAALGVLALVATSALAACGGGGGGSSDGSSNGSSMATIAPVAYVKSAARKTAGVTSEHVALKGSAALNGQALIVTGDGDFAQHSGSMHFDFNAGGLSGTIDATLDGTDLYLRSPLFTAALPPGKTWLKIDLTKVANANGVDLSTLISQDPSQTLARLRSISNVTELGTEQVGGVATTHYRGRVTKAATAPAGVYDVWIGTDDRFVHRMKVASVIGPRQHVVTTVDLSDFGKTVTVDVPPASETYDATNLKIPGLTS
jgi:hypothetical protein